jgi:starch synthase (maltosyl-transferring)
MIMPAESRLNALMQQPREPFAPKIYYFHPLLAGPLGSWMRHFRRVREMGFDHVLTAPFFAPGEFGDIFLTGDHERAHPALGTSLNADDVARELAEACRQQGLQVLVDVVLGRIATDARLAASEPNWFGPAAPSGQRFDPRSSFRGGDAAYARFDDPPIARQLAGWWIERLTRLNRAGVAGFGCADPQLVPPIIWRQVIAAIHRSFPDCRFLAWTPGLDWPDMAGLRGVGFDAAFSSAAWWDGRANWFVEEHELLRGVGSVIGCPEAPFARRLSRRPETEHRLFYRHMLLRAAATGDGLMVPMGFEFAADRDMDRRGGGPADLAGAKANCSSGCVVADISEANALVDQLAKIGVRGEMRILTDPATPVTALLRSDAADVRYARNPIVVMINPDLRRAHALSFGLNPLPPAAGSDLVAQDVVYGGQEASKILDHGEVRIILAQRAGQMEVRPPEVKPAKLATLPRIVIDNVVPAVDGGQFAAKRVIGEAVSIEADVFTDGHELLAVEIMWRAVDDHDWRRFPMRLLGNDRWQATIAPNRIGRYEFTVEAWWDKYGTLCRDLDIKRAAGADLSVEIAEGRQLLERAKERSQADVSKVIASALNWLRDASVETSVDILLCLDLRDVMREVEERHFRYRHEPALLLDVERPQAAYGSWYELFPRSAADTPHRHGNFDDVIRRLPAIRDMGFDVLYLTPIHPIGATNRKGKNNSLRTEQNDVGSPYAIGNSEGGHDAIHPELGTIEDFRRLRDAAAQYGLELALDFAIQCSPDHPWLKDHSEWFNWRPDGSVRYAENPPKKYEDIVNVDFYANNAIPGLWSALRDVVLFWASEGVRIFRVDNPHTKPLPFWEWLIAQVRARHPDVIFLSEAFTRPKMMYRLAKIGFSQSYTYFTWRNLKQELTDYFTELTTSDVKDYFRPHLFVNTPDINPHFLQTSGRPGFLIRAALATTLSGLWGMYSGFEICEAPALPGREEYLNSEKYEIRLRRYDAPGNIVSEISRLNRIRRSHPALQSHLGLRFYSAHNDQIIVYGKPLPAHGDMILVAVNLDPFHPQEATIEVPLWEWDLPDSASVTVRDLMRDVTSAWHGKLQRIRLDPTELPFAIWRITPRPEV